MQERVLKDGFKGYEYPDQSCVNVLIGCDMVQ